MISTTYKHWIFVDRDQNNPNLLSPGGIFLNLEHVASCTPAGEQLFDEFFVDHLHGFHSRSDPDTTRDAIADKYYRRPDKKENILATVEEQCRWLREIGFHDVDGFFKVFELALFGGRKTSNSLQSGGLTASFDFCTECERSNILNPSPRR